MELVDGEVSAEEALVGSEYTTTRNPFSWSLMCSIIRSRVIIFSSDREFC